MAGWVNWFGWVVGRAKLAEISGVAIIWVVGHMRQCCGYVGTILAVVVEGKIWKRRELEVNVGWIEVG